MENLEKTLMQKATGCQRLDPDQQRKYLETFQERVACQVSIAEAKEATVKDNLPRIITSLKNSYSPLYLKISPSLPNDLQLAYLKIGKEQEIATTIVSDDCQHSPFGLILHSDHALNLEYPSIQTYLPQKPSKTESKAKKGFFQKLFGG